MEEKTNIPDERKREVWAIIKQEGQRKDKWVRCGIGFVNRDDSITVLLDTVPVGQPKLILRPWESREEKERRWAATKAASDFAGSRMHPDELFGSAH